MDVLSDVLASVRLSGAVLFTAQFSAPFGVAAPPSERFAPMLVPTARRLIMFHLITEGRCLARAGFGEMMEAEAGDMLLMPYGDAFVLADGKDSAPCSMFELMPPLPWAGPPSIVYGGGGASMRLLCGFLHTDELLLQPLLADLPRLIVIRGGKISPRLHSLTVIAASAARTRAAAVPLAVAAIRRPLRSSAVQTMTRIRPDRPSATGWRSGAGSGAIQRVSVEPPGRDVGGCAAGPGRLSAPTRRSSPLPAAILNTISIERAEAAGNGTR